METRKRKGESMKRYVIKLKPTPSDRNIPYYRVGYGSNWTNTLRLATYYDDTNRPTKLPPNEQLAEVIGDIVEGDVILNKD